MATTMAQQKPYYAGHGRHLRKIIEEYNLKRYGTLNLFSSTALGLFDIIETAVTKKPLRYYQMEALCVLDYLFRTPDYHPVKTPLIEFIDKENDIKAPFISFEMATG